jgi:hypothetical protein
VWNCSECLIDSACVVTAGIERFNAHFTAAKTDLHANSGSQRFFRPVIVSW